VTVTYTYACTIDRVVDGDTIIVDADLGLRAHLTMPVRVYGMNAPEHGTPAGAIATAAASALLPPGSNVTIRTHKATANQGFEKFGRWLAEIFLPDGRSFAEVMIAAGNAVFYDGGAR